MRSHVLVLLVVLAGCKKDAPRPTETAAAKTEEAPAKAPARPAMVSDQYVAAFDAMLAEMSSLNKDMKTAGKDCPKLTAALVAHRDAVKTAGATLSTAAEKDRRATEDFGAGDEWLSKTYDARDAKSKRRLELVWGFCEQDQAFMAALDALDLHLPEPEGRADALEKEFQTLED